MDFRQEWMINDAFKRVPRLGRAWRYVPLHRLPTGTLVRIETKTAVIPETVKSIEPRDRVDLYLREDFVLEVGIQPCMLIQNSVDLEDGTMVKPLSDLLAPTSVFRANFEYKGSTLLAQSGEITKISVLGTGYILHEGDDPNPIRKPRWTTI